MFSAMSHDPRLALEENPCGALRPAMPDHLHRQDELGPCAVRGRLQGGDQPLCGQEDMVNRMPRPFPRSAIRSER